RPRKRPHLLRKEKGNGIRDHQLDVPTSLPKRSALTILRSAKPTPPSIDRIMKTLSAYQRTAALAAAIELDLFTAIAEGDSTPTAIAARLHASERGVRILCDYLVVIGHLRRRGDAYRLTEDSSAFLDRKSPYCISAVTGFLCAPFVMDS